MRVNKAVVTDTHSLIWYLEYSKRLSSVARRTFEDVAAGMTDILVPTIILAETMHLSEH